MGDPKQPAHVQQALAEIDNAQRLGNPDSLRAARKRLEAAGVDAAQLSTSRSEADAQGEQGGKESEVSAEAKQAAKTRPPVGRRTPGAQQDKT